MRQGIEKTRRVLPAFWERLSPEQRADIIARRAATNKARHEQARQRQAILNPPPSRLPGVFTVEQWHRNLAAYAGKIAQGGAT